LDKSFPGLFEIGDNEDVDDRVSSRDDTPGFMRQYGWIYQAKLVADHEKISLEQSFELSTINFLNDLSYIKGKAEYDKEQSRKNGKKY
jgi:hypothetical protein